MFIVALQIAVPANRGVALHIVAQSSERSVAGQQIIPGCVELSLLAFRITRLYIFICLLAYYPVVLPFVYKLFRLLRLLRVTDIETEVVTTSWSLLAALSIVFFSVILASAVTLATGRNRCDRTNANVSEHPCTGSNQGANPNAVRGAKEGHAVYVTGDLENLALGITLAW